jgi:hypothetical protein
MSVDGSALGYQELLRLASSKGLAELDVTIVQVPNEVNRGYAVVTARARTSSATYAAVGECWWDELAGSRTPQALLLAESRAKTRALCELVGMPQALDSQRIVEATASAGGNRAVHPVASTTGGAPRQPAPLPAQRETLREPRAADEPEPAKQVTTEAVRMVTTQSDAAAPAQAADHGATRGRLAPVAQTAVRPGEALGPDVLQKLLQMTRQIGEFKHEDLTEEDALAKLESFFQRAFSHSLAEGTRMEGQRVVQRLAADIARLSQESQSEAAG